ncbi:TonB-dependent receptor [Sphingomonas sp. AOB5]|uniref:TonB-dependent receptor n=1 Tax=Sphingomonas sp. AOB5 TaxID=3034017 RepID=UPI0023F7B962|nr:TonB-dependent receptor [Sphingomonas sp. AOB5]MDF7774333.1 TonB-dependent receptor [Sphingomonas sp. AOB5]
MKFKAFVRSGAATGVILAAMLTAPAALAQTSEEPQSADAQEGEAIVVTGIRGSLARSAEIKREAPQVIDVITSEDVGKLPDANVAEALQRVTGVQITRVFGEGQAVSVRGLQQVRVEVDGRTLLGWSARLSPPENDQLGRSSGLDSVPSSLFGRLEVRKSPLASQVEGGLGGTVNLVTPKPFDFKGNKFSLNAQGTYGQNSEKFEPTVTGLFSTRIADGRIGILVSGEYQKRTSTTQTLERNNFFTKNNGGATNLLAPALLQYEHFVVDRSRLGFNGAVQFEATPELVFTAEGLYSQLTTGRFQDFLAWRLPTSGVIVTNPTIVDGVIVAGTSNGTLTTAGQIRNEPTKNYLFALNGKYDNGRLTIVGDGYYSKGTIDQTIQIITLQATAAVPGTFDFRAGPVPSLFLGTISPTGVRTPFNLTSYSSYNPATSGVRSNRLIGVLEEWTGKIDLSYKFDGGVTLYGGVRYTALKARSNAYRSQVTPTRAEIEPYLRVTGDGYFLPDIPGDFPRIFLSTGPTYDYVFNRAQAAQPNPAVSGGLLPNPARDYDLIEKTIGGYLMFAAEGHVLGMPTKVNAGVRLISTDFSVDSLLQSGTTAAPVFNPVNDKSSYTNVLPSANIVFNVTDNFLVRASASQTMQRAGIAELAPSIFVNTTNRTASGGNAQLIPPSATNLDLSFEYYTGRTSLISGAIFYKDVSNFIATNTTLGVFPGYESLGIIPFTRPDNVASAKVKGFEVGIQQFFDFLPAPFDGLGLIANYTYSDAKDSNGFPLVATSKHSYNIIGLFEKGPFSARIAYNWRDEAVFEFTEGRPSYIGPRAQLDAQIGISLTDNFSLSFNAQNLMPDESATVEYSLVGPIALNSYALSERRYSAGIRVRF